MYWNIHKTFTVYIKDEVSTGKVKSTETLPCDVHKKSTFKN